MKKPDKPVDVQKIIKKAVDLILIEDAEKKIKAILLFGSHANNTAIWRSDIDICVVFREDPTNLESGRFRREIMGELPDIVDLQVFNVLPLKVKKTIADNHKVLFSTKDFDENSLIIYSNKLFFELQNRKAITEVA